MIRWQKVRDLLEAQGLKGDFRKEALPPFWLEIRVGPHKSSYRVRFRQGGISVEETLKGDFKSWQEALKAGDLAICRAKVLGKPKPKNLIRCEDLCWKIVDLKKPLADGTYKQAELFYRLHIIPYLNDFCPYATELTAATWLEYKAYKRTNNPKVTLFNHWKFFTMLCVFASKKGILPNKIDLDFDEESEDFREEGLVISDDHFEKMLRTASPDWHDRLYIGRRTGMRPGEARCLRKDRINLSTGEVRLRKEDTKTRKARSFLITDTLVLTILKRRWLASETDYFFPSTTLESKPQGPNYRGWERMLRRAEVNPDYTPHDLRHTYLTEMFKTSLPPALLCYQAGLSMEEAQKTYLHFRAEDTRKIADYAAKKG